MTIKTELNDAFFVAKGFSVSTDKSRLSFTLIYDFLTKESYWAKDISSAKLEKAIANSLCFGIYHEQKQIGFARVVSDYATFAYLADVFIVKTYRKKGLSKWLIQNIIQHPNLNDVRRFMLATADAHGLYQQFGFEALSQPDMFMQKIKPYAKKTKQ